MFTQHHKAAGANSRLKNLGGAIIPKTTVVRPWRWVYITSDYDKIIPRF